MPYQVSFLHEYRFNLDLSLVLHFKLIFGRPLSCPVLSCLSVCLSVTLVYCGQTVGWIKMKLGTEVGLGPGHTVFDGNPTAAPSSPKA